MLIENDTLPVVAGVEFGGTKVIVTLGQRHTILEQVRIATTTPSETLQRVREQLCDWDAGGRIRGLGIGSFGPLSVNPKATDFGQILRTPKAGWEGINLFTELSGSVSCPIAIQTDVTAAAMAEGRIGAARGCRDFVYVTVGTGVGMGIIANGQPVTGMLHPEAGHMRVRRERGDTFAGVCPFHGDCLEGLSSGPAIAARIGADPASAGMGHPGWHHAADALAESFATLFLTLACERIVVGGGVGINASGLIDLVRPRVIERLGGYLPFIDDASIDSAIVSAGLASEAGPIGTLLLASNLVDEVQAA